MRWVGSYIGAEEAREELYPRLWGLRVAEHVAAGCEGEWPEWSRLGPVMPRDFRSHRDWCPRFAGTLLDPNAEANNYLRRLRGEPELPMRLARSEGAFQVLSRKHA
jgi:hypothetical protein